MNRTIEWLKVALVEDVNSAFDSIKTSRACKNLRNKQMVDVIKMPRKKVALKDKKCYICKIKWDKELFLSKKSSYCRKCHNKKYKDYRDKVKKRTLW